MAECPTARNFFANQGDLTPPYFVYGKENQRRVAEKDPPFGRFDIFQTRPREKSKGGIPVALITERYAAEIQGVLTSYDRMIIQGYVAAWSHSDGMTSYLNTNHIKIFDYQKFCEPLTRKVRSIAEEIAKESGIEIEFIRKLKAFRKEERVHEIIKSRQITTGLVHIFSAMESCNTYKPWYDKTSGRTFLKYDTSICLHFYFYFIDKGLGLCYLRVPTWPPFRLQFYSKRHK